jgi:hypothetical protein
MTRMYKALKPRLRGARQALQGDSKRTHKGTVPLYPIRDIRVIRGWPFEESRLGDAH